MSVVRAEPIRHGYSLSDLEQLARMALWRSWGMVLDLDTRYEVAWSALAEHLCSRCHEPQTGMILCQVTPDRMPCQAYPDGHE